MANRAKSYELLRTTAICEVLHPEQGAVIRDRLSRTTDKWSLWALSELTANGPLDCIHRQRHPVITRPDKSDAGTICSIPKASVSAQGEAEGGADARISDSAAVSRASHRRRAGEAA